MSFSPAFTVSQSAASPAYVSFEDTSVGSDPAIASRRIYVTDSQGNAVVPSGTNTSYISWALVDNPVSVNLLTEDLAVNVIVQWLDSGNSVLYTSQNDFCLAEYNQQFFYGLISTLAQNPGTLQDVNYKQNLELLWIYIIGAQNAISLAADTAGAQDLLNMATSMRLNEKLFY